MVQRIDDAAKALSSAVDEELANANKRLLDYEQQLKAADTKRSEIQQRLDEIEDRERLSVERAESAESRLKIIESLKSESYANAVKELFEQPKLQLVSVVNERVSSLQFSTGVWTVVSLLIGGLISAIMSYVFQTFNDRETEKLQRELTNLSSTMRQIIDDTGRLKTDMQVAVQQTTVSANTLKGLDRRVGSVESRANSIGSAIEGARIEKDVSVALEQIVLKSRKRIKPSESKHHAALTYKLGVNREVTSISNDSLYRAFLSAGFSIADLEEDPNIFSRWDREIFALFEKWDASVSGKNDAEKPERSDLLFQTFKLSSDQTNYENWGYHKAGTYRELKTSIANERKFLKKVN
jgi:hypothetical protein